ncbi:MAG: hypothetical protein A3D87_01575 [Omnitrophica WOR_2 bacterium RIFCSPHIGHO2_02_FULL_50_17]|nr:MAG: hypothetical protein A3D87_01575 [Omnitrophica WOR_2 bacterium RIFCSPHIGHO2_02_FULL_50_17]
MAHEHEKSATPEKQLLNLIEDPKAEKLKQRKMRQISFSFLTLDAFRGRFSFFGEKIRLSLTPGRVALDLKGINAILRVCIGILSLWVAGALVNTARNFNRLPDFGLEALRTANGSEKLEDQLKKIDPYLEKVRGRNVFQFGGVAVPVTLEEPEPQEEVLPPSLADDLAKNLRLVGIGWSDEPDVMIEDTATKKVYFLKRGDWIDGKIKINAILQDRVILSLEGREMELK